MAPADCTNAAVEAAKAAGTSADTALTEAQAAVTASTAEEGSDEKTGLKAAVTAASLAVDTKA